MKCCTVQFEPGKSGLGVLRFKGLVLEPGKPVEVKADMAGWLQRECPQGAEIRLLKGKAEDPPDSSQPAKIKEAVRQAEEFGKAGVDPVEALKGIPQLSAESMEAIREAKSPEDAVKLVPPALRPWFAISCWVTGQPTLVELSFALVRAE